MRMYIKHVKLDLFAQNILITGDEIERKIWEKKGLFIRYLHINGSVLFQKYTYAPGGFRHNESVIWKVFLCHDVIMSYAAIRQETFQHGSPNGPNGILIDPHTVIMICPGGHEVCEQFQIAKYIQVNMEYTD